MHYASGIKRFNVTNMKDRHWIGSSTLMIIIYLDTVDLNAVFTYSRPSKRTPLQNVVRICIPHIVYCKQMLVSSMGGPAPVCNHCEDILTVLRIAQACPHYDDERKTFHIHGRLHGIPGDDRGNASSSLEGLANLFN
jgi:hypothetical protein